jgi:hypothetical protein
MTAKDLPSRVPFRLSVAVSTFGNREGLLFDKIMKTTTEEHLTAIVARCEELLNIATKRTPGTWRAAKLSEYRADVLHKNGTLLKLIRGNDGKPSYREATVPDATFIAATAGTAEAGWKSTIVAIENLRIEQRLGNQPVSQHASRTLATIIAAWPLETLNTKTS